MKCKLRKGFLFVIAAVLVLASVGVAFATETEAMEPICPAHALGVVDPGSITPYWVGISNLTAEFQMLSGGLANPMVFGTVYSGVVDRVNVVVALKKGSGTTWITIKTWNQNVPISFNSYTFNQTYSVPSGYAYKYSTTVKSYKNNVLVDSVSLNSSILIY